MVTEQRRRTRSNIETAVVDEINSGKGAVIAFAEKLKLYK